jgi:hypothetical protein
MTKGETMSARFCFAAILSLAACGGSGNNPPLPSGDFAVVTTSGGFGAGGAVNTIKLSDMMVDKGLDTTIDQDNQVRIFDGKAYVLDRGPGTLRIYDIKTWTSPVEIPTGDATADHATSNPEDVLPVGGNRVYVSMGGNDSAHALGIIDVTSTTGVEKWIALPTQTADSDGHPEAFMMYGCGGKAYVLMGDYDDTTYALTGPSRIAVVDTSTDTLEGFITLTTSGPNAIAGISADCHDVIVSNAGTFGVAPDGTAGLEHVDLAQMKSLGVLISDSTLAGRPNSVSIASHTLGFSSIYFDLEPDPTTGMPILSSTKVVAFDPSTGKLLGDVTGKAVFISFAAVTPNNLLMVGVDDYPGSLDMGKLPSGLYVGPADGTMLPTTPIDLGQNPYAIAFQ